MDYVWLIGPTAVAIVVAFAWGCRVGHSSGYVLGFRRGYDNGYDECSISSSRDPRPNPERLPTQEFYNRGVTEGRRLARQEQLNERRAAGMPASSVRSETAAPAATGRSRVVMIDGDITIDQEQSSNSSSLPDVEVVQVTVDLSGAVPVTSLSQATAALRNGNAIVASLDSGMITIRVCRIPVGYYTEVRHTDGQPVRVLFDTAKQVQTWLRGHFRRR